MANSRSVAFKILYKVLAEGAYSALTLNSCIKNSDLTPIDASFTSALVYGVLERKLTLEYIIKQYSKIPLRKIEAKTRIILCMGIYQLLFMDKVPESAAVNESVKLSKKLGLSKSSGFINGILRNITRAEVKYTLPNPKDEIKFLSVKYSCPESIVSVFLNSYGNEITTGILNSLSGRPPLCVRVNTLKTDAQTLIKELSDCGVKASVSPICDTALVIENSGSVENLLPFKEGKMYVQDIASQLCTKLLSPKPDETVIDVCSAPGGKSFSSALLMKNEGQIYAYDIYSHKLELINKTANRLSISIINTDIRDGSDESKPLPYADKILCDVPCSGFGILRRKPEIRYKDHFNLEELSQIQYKILTNSAKYLKVGGVLVYSTCTLNPLENSKNAERFLNEHKDFEPYPLNLSSLIKRGIAEKENELTLFTHLNGTDGFYISAFRRAK